MSAERELIPVLVDAAGRSGTTALMQLLASSPAVVVEREYPYESRYLTYLYSWARMLDGDPKAARKWERRKMLQGAPAEIGGLPWRDLLSEPSEMATECFRSAWGHFSSGTPAGGSHYIEKVPRWISEAMPKVLPATRAIYLIRDPRDIWLSISAFNAKRGFLSFGRRKDQSEDEFLKSFIESQRERLEPLAGRELRDGELLLRYENLVADAADVASQLGSWLGLEFDPGAFARREESHATSGSVADSVGRWKRELCKSTRRQFDTRLGGILASLGYS